MRQEKEADNLRAARAKDDPKRRNTFLEEEADHILRLTGKLCNKVVTEHDEEWSVALLALDEALQKYEEARGDFWPFASYVIKNRLTDHYRKEGLRTSREMSVDGDCFSGETNETDRPDGNLRKELTEKTAVYVNSDLKDEIEDLRKELDGFQISFFDLAEVSPKSKKTKAGCKAVIEAILEPPPLTREIREMKTLPVAKILKRRRLPRKLLERHRKYLIAATLVADGDYPLIAEYLPIAGPKGTKKG